MKSDRDSVFFWAGLAVGSCPCPPGSPRPTQGPLVGHRDPWTYHPPSWAITPTHPLCPAFLHFLVPVLGSLYLVIAPRSLFPPGFSHVSDSWYLFLPNLLLSLFRCVSFLWLRVLLSLLAHFSVSSRINLPVSLSPCVCDPSLSVYWGPCESVSLHFSFHICSHVFFLSDFVLLPPSSPSFWSWVPT